MATFQFLNETGFAITNYSKQSQTIEVYGLASPVTSVAVLLRGLDHTFAADLDMLLVGPGSNRNLEFWSDANGQDNLVGAYQSLDNGAFQLTDGSSGSTPQEGAYKPVDYGEVETDASFGSAVGSINHATTNGGASFASIFNGMNGNGTWAYYLADDSGGDTGTLASWVLSITTASQVAQVNGTAGNDTISATSSGVNAGTYSLNNFGEVFFSDVTTLILDGQGGDDTIVGSSAVDNIDGGAGRDTIHAGRGADVITVVAGEDTAGEVYDGGLGTDTLTLTALLPQNYTIDLRDDGLGSLEVLYFSVTVNTSGTVLLNGSQFGSGLALAASLSPTSLVNFAATVDVTMGSVTSLDLSRLFMDPAFGSDDKVVVRGDGDAETITGTSITDLLYGNAGTDTLSGGTGNDTLEGGGGADTLDGGSENDTYVLGSEAQGVDTVTDSSGIDTILSTISRNLSFADYSEIERLTLQGNAAIDGAGNGNVNILVGNGAANTLNTAGGAGADTLYGLGGNDKYIIKAGDIVDETFAGSSGTDTVFTAANYTLPTNVENLTLTSFTAQNGRGNGLANAISGNAYTNILTGGGLNDTLSGGDGVDYFDFNLASDSTVAARDTITDFQDFGDVDLIDLRDILPGDPATTKLSFGGNLAAFTATNQVIFSAAGAHIVVSVNLDADSAAEMQILLLNTTVAQIQGTDFLL